MLLTDSTLEVILVLLVTPSLCFEHIQYSPDGSRHFLEVNVMVIPVFRFFFNGVLIVIYTVMNDASLVVPPVLLLISIFRGVFYLL